MMTATFKGKLNKTETAIRNAYVTSLYDSGKSPVEIMQITGIPSSTVYECIKRHVEEHPERAQRKWQKTKANPEPVKTVVNTRVEYAESVIKMYKDGATYQEIRSVVGCSDGTISNIINAAGIPKRGCGKSAKKAKQTPKANELTDADIDRIARRVAEILAAKIAA